MDHIVTHVREPSRLYLAWQAPDEIADRHRWAVGEVTQAEGGSTYQLVYFRGEKLSRLNANKDEAVLHRYGYRGYPGLELDKLMHSRGVKEALLRRLPPQQRSDFADFKKRFLLPEDRTISDFALLARTEAKLPGDGFSLVDPLDGEGDEAELMLEVAGYRHLAPRIPPARLPKVGMPVRLILDRDNSKDANAVAIDTLEGERIGFINRLQTGPFHRWLQTHDVKAEVARLNGSQGKPRAFVFIQIRPTLRVAA